MGRHYAVANGSGWSLQVCAAIFNSKQLHLQKLTLEQLLTIFNLCKEYFSISTIIKVADVQRYLSLHSEVCCWRQKWCQTWFVILTSLISCFCTHASLHIHKSFPLITLPCSRNLYRHSGNIGILKGNAWSNASPPSISLTSCFAAPTFCWRTDSISSRHLFLCGNPYLCTADWKSIFFARCVIRQRTIHLHCIGA